MFPLMGTSTEAKRRESAKQFMGKALGERGEQEEMANVEKKVEK